MTKVENLNNNVTITNLRDNYTLVNIQRGYHDKYVCLLHLIKLITKNKPFMKQ